MTYRSLITVSIAAVLLASPAAAGPTPTSKKDDVASTNQAALRQPSDASVVGALHEFAYERGALYAIQASPQRITDTRDARGDVARTLLYMSHVYDLPLDGAIKDRDLLLAWHQADLPDTEEIARERRIRKLQNSWNPLILPAP